MSLSAPRAGQDGFTILELTITLGLLASFLVMLTQLLTGGVSLFDEGEASQELSDLGNAASQAVSEAVSDMAGPRWQSFQPTEPDARLIAQWVPLGLQGERERASSVQAVRATVQVSPEREAALLRELLRDQLDGADAGSPEMLEQQLEEAVAAMPRQGRAEMLMLAWPSGDEDGAFLDVRCGFLLPGQKIAIDRRREVGLMEVDHLDDGTLNAEQIVKLTDKVATGLLHVEFAFRSQYTRSFEASGASGPEWVWDSARAGLFAETEDQKLGFRLDLAPDSLRNTTDDVFPRTVRIVVIVARQGREARLARDLGAGANELTLLTTNRVPGIADHDHVKIGGEWVRFGRVSGTKLTGLQRGQRMTRPSSHPAGTRVRLGKQVTVFVNLPHGRDNWNG